MTYDIECVRCGLCVRECDQFAEAIALTDTGVRVDGDRCKACGHCTALCPTDAMEHPLAPKAPPIGELPGPAQMARYLRQPRSVRCFKEGLVPHGTLMELLDIGRYPQTAVNSQGISYLVVEGHRKMEALAEVYCRTVIDRAVNDPLRPQLGDIVRRQLETGKDILFRGAPQLLLALCDEDNARGRDSARFALTFIALLAPALGVGTCWAGYLEALALDAAYAPVFHAHLQVPPGKRIAAGMMLGLPDVSYRRLVERDPLQVEWR